MKNLLVAGGPDDSPSISALSFSARICWAILGVLLCLLPSCGAAEQPVTKKTVLLLFSGFDQRSTFSDLFESSVRARVPGEITFYEEYLEPAQMENEPYLESQAETLHHWFSRARPDLVVAVSYAALQFTTQYRDRMFPGVPIVFAGVGAARVEGKTWPGVTGLTMPVGLKETIDLALRLEPDTKSIALVGARDSFWLAAAHSELLGYQNRVREIDLFGPAGPELLNQVAALPPHTVILYDLTPPTSGQPPLAGPDLIDAIAQRVPTYSVWAADCLNHGCIGGAFDDRTKETQLVAGTAARVLKGERPDNIPIGHATFLQVEVDWRALHRWHISESAVPAGSIVLYRPPDFWATFGMYVLAGVLLLLAQSVAIFALLWQTSKIKKAESRLRESEERFRLVANTAPIMIWMSGTDKLCTYLNQTWLEFTGRSLKQELGIGWMEGIHAEDLRALSESFDAVFARRNPFKIEYRLRRHDGEYRWIFDYGVPRFNADGSFAGYIGCSADVTERRTAEEALSTMSRRLIEAQEEERTWIARELHDDISQRVAVVSLNLEGVLRNDLSPDAQTRSVAEAIEEIKRIVSDIHALSHRLHSSKLEYLGLVAACRGFCNELSERQNVEIEFVSDSVPENLSKEVSLCLFRVLQEALQNAVKYSGVLKFHVSLRGGSNEVELRVHDSGAGFDPEKAISGHGLGLTSMKGRLKLVDGWLFIDSEPGHGTTIHARVPLRLEQPSQEAAG